MYNLYMSRYISAEIEARDLPYLFGDDELESEEEDHIFNCAIASLDPYLEVADSWEREIRLQEKYGEALRESTHRLTAMTLENLRFLASLVNNIIRLKEST